MKLVIDAGHGYNTPGKRIPENASYALSANRGMREWILNARIVEDVISRLAAYDNVEIVRTDDPTGKVDVAISDRHAPGDLFLSVHHNAGLDGRKGGGVVVYTVTRPDQNTSKHATAFYASVVKYNGNKGNRATPISSANYTVLTRSECPVSLLLENGFMDGPDDANKICTEYYAKDTAAGIIAYLEEMFGIQKKSVTSTPSTEEKLYRVQVGAFKDKQNAVKLLEDLVKAGFTGYIKEGE